jgi:cobalt-zinc-cadmium efflux system outer membrane protein
MMPYRMIKAYYPRCLLFLGACWVAVGVPIFAQTPPTVAAPSPEKLSSSEFIDATGWPLDKLLANGAEKRADLLAARQRLATAEGRVTQANARPNPTLDAEYSQAKLLGGQSEGDFGVGVTQVFERGGKRSKRVVVARLELAQTRAEVLALERQYAAGLRAGYARAVAAGRQLDALERLIAVHEELLSVTGARLKEGDVAPLDLNLLRVETDRLRVQTVRAKADLESEIIVLRTLAGLEQSESLRIAPLPETPPRFELSLAEVTDLALRGRADVQAARLGEELGQARVSLARSEATPDVALSLKYSRQRDAFDDTPVGPLSDTDQILTFGVSIGLPVFNKNQGNIAAAASEQVTAQRQREFLEATVKRDVAFAYRRYKAAAEAYALYLTAILPRAQENLKSVRAAYGLGEFSVFEVVNEQRRLLENQTGSNEALRDYYAALAELESALGGPLPAAGFASPTTSVLPDERLFRLARPAVRLTMPDTLPAAKSDNKP